MEDQQVADYVLQHKLSMSDGQIHKGLPIGEGLYYPNSTRKCASSGMQGILSLFNNSVGIRAIRVVLYTSELQSKFKKMKSKMPVNGEQVWNNTPFNTSAGKLLNDLTHAHEGKALVIFMFKRNYDPQYRNSRNKDNSIANQCQIKATSREPVNREKSSKRTNTRKDLYEL